MTDNTTRDDPAAAVVMLERVRKAAETMAESNQNDAPANDPFSRGRCSGFESCGRVILDHLDTLSPRRVQVVEGVVTAGYADNWREIRIECGAGTVIGTAVKVLIEEVKDEGK